MQSDVFAPPAKNPRCADDYEYTVVIGVEESISQFSLTGTSFSFATPLLLDVEKFWVPVIQTHSTYRF